MPDPDATAIHPLTLLIVDDHEVVRQGLVALLGRRPEFQVVAEAGTVVEGQFRPGQSGSEWMDTGVLRTLRGRSLARWQR